MISPLTCAQCGQALQLNQHFCNNCGAPVVPLPQQPAVPVAPVAQANVPVVSARRRRKSGWKRGLLVSLLLLLVGTIGAVVLGLISYDRNVSIQDQARVLNIGQLQQTISDMPYDLNIVTIQHFNGSTDDFTRQYSVNDIAIITIAIDVENRFLTISGGSEVPLSNNQYASAVSAFRSTIHQNNYTDATIAALLDIKHSLGISVFFIDAGRTIRLSVYHLVGQQRVNSLFSALGVILIIALVGGFLLLILYNIIKGVLMLLWATFCLLTGRRLPAAFKKRNRGGDSESRDSYYREMYNHPVDTSSGSGGEASSHF